MRGSSKRVKHITSLQGCQRAIAPHGLLSLVGGHHLLYGPDCVHAILALESRDRSKRGLSQFAASALGHTNLINYVQRGFWVPHDFLVSPAGGRQTSGASIYPSAPAQGPKSVCFLLPVQILTCKSAVLHNFRLTTEELLSCLLLNSASLY